MMNGLTDKQVEKLKQKLSAEITAIETHFEEEQPEVDGGSAESLRASTGELSTSDNHPADLGTETFERTRDMAVDRAFEEQLTKMSDALDRIQSGDYGKCLICSGEIGHDRLEAIPYTAYCIDHTPRKTSSTGEGPDAVTDAPQIPSPDTDSLPDGAYGLDDADAWRSAEDHGTSDTPTREIDTGELEQLPKGLK
ncbi:conjugal transfer protein TraR [Paenibacillus mendelii]|uniref:Conjugal transfer protein TraR n=1 Tax=Paenibacillus mendelii TaxID=206163 RepID=A0ABV6JKC5_9BACL|nr:conjugal transfer protein TraR [Paenibacillus mendelii]MCQ6558922.1 conjugal transfer protein TraR [Paenibacillus mendelii]